MTAEMGEKIDCRKDLHPVDARKSKVKEISIVWRL